MDAVRFWASLSVIWSHAFPISGQTEPTIAGFTIGEIAVAVFFLLSGYLITWSYVKTNDPLKYLWARVLRIFPGLVIVLLFTAFVVGPFFTHAPLGKYLAATPHYILHNLPIFKGVSDSLPGVFVDNPLPTHVNGSLWTLNYEFRCYLLILALGFCRLLHPVLVGLLLVMCLIGVFSLDRVNSWQLWSTAYFTAIFLVGALVWFVGISWSPRFQIPYPFQFGDLSYGVYIYAFPIEQATVQALGCGWFVTGLISTAIVLPVAALSWRFVERPALELKRSRPS